METGLRFDDEARISSVRWNHGEALPALQKAVGGCVDVVSLTPGIDMWLNDEGMMLTDINGPATRLARLHGYRHQPYWGPVVITGHRQGETIGLSAAARAWLTGWLKGRCTAIFEELGDAACCGADVGHQGVHSTLLDHRLRLWHGPARSLEEIGA